jgi:predicted permease
MATLARDIRYAMRMLVATPAFTLTAVAVLALGIGANTAVFTIVNELLFRPLPGQGDGRLVGLYSRRATPEGGYRAVSWPNYQDLREGTDAFEAIVAHDLTVVGLAEGDATRRVFAAVVSSNYFPVLGAAFTHGRGFSPDEERAGSNLQVAVVSHALWQRHGGDPSFVGSTLRLNGRRFAVVGVAPRGFGGTTALVSPEIWLPAGVYEMASTTFGRGATQKRLDDRSNHAFILLGRLAPGVTLEAATARLRQQAQQLAEAFPAENRDYTFEVGRLSRTSISTNPQDDSELTTLSTLLATMSGVVLLVACLNLANMLLARGVGRRKEIAIRLAIGAGRLQVVRQLLAEALVLALLGAAAGLLVAYWAVGLLLASLVPLLPLVLTFDPAPDLRVLGATLACSVVATVLFGLGPALRVSRPDVTADLKEQQTDTAQAGRWRLLAPRHVLVVAQMALSLALLVVGGLFVRGALEVASVDPGFSLDRQLLVAIDPSLAGHDEPRGRALYARVLERVRAMPDVEAASVASAVPFGDYQEGRRVRRPGPRVEDEPRVSANYTIVGAGYFATLGIPVLRGRDFTAAEEASPATGVRAAIIDEPLARRLWGDHDPLGEQIQLGDAEPGELPQLYEVVGIVPGMRHDLFDRELVSHLYVPHGSHYRDSMTMHVRTSATGADAEAAVLRRVRAEVRGVDERLPVLTARTFAEHRDASLLTWVVKAGARLFMAFGLLALFLAVLGVYGVRASAVARRTREIGIRMALGADRAAVLQLVLREGLQLTLAGIAIGLLLAAGAARLVASLLFRVSPFDPIVFVATALVLTLATLAASYLPARKAAQVMPMEALRSFR